ncbi:MAG: MarR family transcriptional regulator [Hydrogenophaga sp.]|jgi:DNA-binding MarR family transcriptional regulator|uniref:MarR family winged helix-turn-helix transcriptional regulator n=1 Tax=Hydrogenophaga sp. TaxID=1904254 RepID=UPI002725CF56|nr:MarR family transcriptional regulator [Hydrogenophaga sp.]MDO9479346.1 MarR family transcriptional regulator [Hydrogenophaga sp.]MDO9504886.1 MarR family transcriptional regulator [Hydrogenophaga sp.]MDP1893507.1 MarR family transcriptional regulator [Hydrogenophaga sp.]MDP2219181.1 MarR family transcriptional regulator [Hydrogenophaga sp.]MDP3344520.1 MarR family transcriptional regulator [Hydrogenophaga sp.]
MKTVPSTSIDIDQQPGHAIRRLHQISVGIFLQEAGDLGITPVQYAALQVVGNQPGIDQRTLARNIALDASTTGGVVDRLEVRGWLERKTSPEDRRARQLTLTLSGEQALRDAVPVMLRAQEQILAPLTDSQRTTFMELLQQLVTQNNELSRAPSEVTGK